MAVMNTDRHLTLVVTPDMLDAPAANALIWERLFNRCAHLVEPMGEQPLVYKCTKCEEVFHNSFYSHQAAAQIPIAPNFLQDARYSSWLYNQLVEEPLGCVVQLTNMQAGRRGRFLTLGYHRLPVDSFHHTLSLEDATGSGHMALIAYAALFLIQNRPWPLVSHELVIDVEFTVENL